MTTYYRLTAEGILSETVRRESRAEGSAQGRGVLVERWVPVTEPAELVSGQLFEPVTGPGPGGFDAGTVLRFGPARERLCQPLPATGYELTTAWPVEAWRAAEIGAQAKEGDTVTWAGAHPFGGHATAAEGHMQALAHHLAARGLRLDGLTIRRA